MIDDRDLKRLFGIIAKTKEMPLENDGDVMNLFNVLCLDGVTRTNIKNFKEESHKEMQRLGHLIEVAEYKTKLLEAALFFAVNSAKDKQSAMALINILQDAGINFSYGTSNKPKFIYKGLDVILKRQKESRERDASPGAAIKSP